MTALLGVFLLLASPAVAVRLRWDPEYSPPSAALSASRPELYRAYNRPLLSRTTRPVRVLVEDDNGNRITTGGNAVLSVSVRIEFAINVESPVHATDEAIFAAMAPDNNQVVWERTRQVLRQDNSVWFMNGAAMTVSQTPPPSWTVACLCSFC